MPAEEFQTLVLEWFARHGRKNLPWQQNISAYRVWVSEIMLQQTQVASVIGYYNRFIERFPDVFALAEADLDSVLGHWAGLGYYARARNLHRTARIVAENGGEFPLALAELTALPGIGRSTAGAILSIAHGQQQPILDGNVKRVLARFHAIAGWPGDGKIADRLWQLSAAYTPNHGCANFTQAMMDLGATLCTRANPLCPTCPIAEGCAALKQNLVGTLPEAKPRQTLPVKQLYLLIAETDEQQILLERRPLTGIWGGLWSLPEFEGLPQLENWLQQQNHPSEKTRILPAGKHNFSHYQLQFTPVLASVKNPSNNVMEADRLVWYKPEQLKQLGLPTPIKRLLKHLNMEITNDENG